MKKTSRASLALVGFLIALSFIAVVGFYQVLSPPRAGFTANPSSAFTFSHSERVELIDEEPRVGVPFTLNLTDGEVAALRPPSGASHVVTLILDSGERYSIFETRGGGLVGVLWRTEGGLIDKIGEGRVSLRCIKNLSESSVQVSGNSTYVRNATATIYRLESSLMPEALAGSLYQVDLNASMTWVFLGQRHAEVHARARFFVEYGVAVVRGYDYSYDWTRPGVARCSFSHSISGVGTTGASVRADGHYTICYAVASKHANMGAWHSVDAWLNVGPPGGYGYEYGKIWCGC